MKFDVVIICIGQAASITAVLLANNAAKKRFSLPNARILIHQPWLTGLSGQAIEKIEKDVERDFIMTADQAKEYGLIDEIIYKHR